MAAVQAQPAAQVTASSYCYLIVKKAAQISLLAEAVNALQVYRACLCVSGGIATPSKAFESALSWQITHRHEMQQQRQKQQQQQHNLGQDQDCSWELQSSDDDSDRSASKSEAAPDFFDPELDEVDETFVARQRNGRRSDAHLSCPGCFTTLCTDCQQHAQAQHRFRAIFVLNCRCALC